MQKERTESDKIKAVVTALISRMSVLEQNYIAIANQQTKFCTLSNRVEILEKQLYSDIAAINDNDIDVKPNVDIKEKEKPKKKRQNESLSSSWVDEEPKKKKKKQNTKRAPSVASSITSESSELQSQAAEEVKSNSIDKDIAPDYSSSHQCTQCQHQAPNERSLEDHNKKIHAEVETLYCAKCSFNSVVKQELIDHFKSVHKKPPSEESKKTTNKNSSSSYVEDSSDSNLNQAQPYGEYSYNSHECSQCKHRANSKRELEDHIKKNHSDVETLYCAKCSYNSVVKQELIDHFRSIHRKPKD